MLSLRSRKPWRLHSVHGLSLVPSFSALEGRLTCCSHPTALSWFLGKHNVQDTIEEIEEEKRSLASVKSISIWQLLLDHSVRWQVLSVIVINMGMQLSGIDAVRTSVLGHNLWE